MATVQITLPVTVTTSTRGVNARVLFALPVHIQARQRVCAAVIHLGVTFDGHPPIEASNAVAGALDLLNDFRRLRGC